MRSKLELIPCDRKLEAASAASVVLKVGEPSPWAGKQWPSTRARAGTNNYNGIFALTFGLYSCSGTQPKEPKVRFYIYVFLFALRDLIIFLSVAYSVYIDNEAAVEQSDVNMPIYHIRSRWSEWHHQLTEGLTSLDVIKCHGLVLSCIISCIIVEVSSLVVTCCF